MAFVVLFGSHRTHLAAASHTSSCVASEICFSASAADAVVVVGVVLVTWGGRLFVLVERDLGRPVEPVTCLSSGLKKRPRREKSPPMGSWLEPWRRMALATRTVVTLRMRRTLVQ